MGSPIVRDAHFSSDDEEGLPDPKDVLRFLELDGTFDDIRRSVEERVGGRNEEDKDRMHARADRYAQRAMDEFWSGYANNRDLKKNPPQKKEMFEFVSSRMDEGRLGVRLRDDIDCEVNRRTTVNRMEQQVQRALDAVMRGERPIPPARPPLQHAAAPPSRHHPSASPQPASSPAPSRSPAGAPTSALAPSPAPASSPSPAPAPARVTTSAPAAAPAPAPRPAPSLAPANRPETPADAQAVTNDATTDDMAPELVQQEEPAKTGNSVLPTKNSDVDASPAELPADNSARDALDARSTGKDTGKGANRAVEIGDGRMSVKLIRKGAIRCVGVLIDNPLAKEFRDPVDPSLTDYHQAIENPICLNDVMGKIESESYETLFEVFRDIDRIWSNCLQYNGRDHEYTRKALKLRKIANERKLLLYKYFNLEDPLEELKAKKKKKKKKKRDTLLGKARKASRHAEPDEKRISSAEEEERKRPEREAGVENDDGDDNIRISKRGKARRTRRKATVVKLEDGEDSEEEAKPTRAGPAASGIVTDILQATAEMGSSDEEQREIGKQEVQEAGRSGFKNEPVQSPRRRQEPDGVEGNGEMDKPATEDREPGDVPESEKKESQPQMPNDEANGPAKNDETENEDEDEEDKPEGLKQDSQKQLQMDTAGEETEEELVEEELVEESPTQPPDKKKNGDEPPATQRRKSSARKNRKESEDQDLAEEVVEDKSHGDNDESRKSDRKANPRVAKKAKSRNDAPTKEPEPVAEDEDESEEDDGAVEYEDYTDVAGVPLQENAEAIKLASRWVRVQGASTLLYFYKRRSDVAEDHKDRQYLQDVLWRIQGKKEPRYSTFGEVLDDIKKIFISWVGHCELDGNAREALNVFLPKYVRMARAFLDSQVKVEIQSDDGEQKDTRPSPNESTKSSPSIRHRSTTKVHGKKRKRVAKEDLDDEPEVADVVDTTIHDELDQVVGYKRSRSLPSTKRTKKGAFRQGRGRKSQG